MTDTLEDYSRRNVAPAWRHPCEKRFGSALDWATACGLVELANAGKLSWQVRLNNPPAPSVSPA